MRITTGKVIAGKVVFEDSSLVEGATVYLVTSETAEKAQLSPEELAELEAGLAEADSGFTVSADELFEQLRRHG